MKRFVLIASIFLFNGLYLWAQRGEDPIYESVVVETFDGPGATKFPSGTNARMIQENGSTQIVDISGQDVTWYVDNSLASRYATEGFPAGKYTSTWPIDLFGVTPQNAESLQVYGVRSKFDRQGYNYFAVYSGAEIDGKWQAQALPLTPNDLPGRIKNINVWVWGANYDYTIEMHVRDYQGAIHVIPMHVVSGVNRQRYRSGSLRFVGWRKMAANVPNRVPQDSRYNLQDYRLKFVKFVIRTNPYERVDDFYIYFDQMQATLDTYSNYYDGKNLAQPDRIRELWGDNASGGDNANLQSGQ